MTITIVDVMVAHHLGGAKELAHFNNQEDAYRLVSRLDEEAFAFADVIYHVKTDDTSDHLQTRFTLLENLQHELQP
jgi:hypothetical protein